MSNKTLGIISALKQWLRKQIGYLDQQLMSFGANGELLCNDLTLPPKVLILSRHHYSEKVQWLPVEKRSAARTLIRAQQNTSNIVQLYWIGEPVNGKTPVLWFTPTADLPASAWLVVPETLLLAYSFSKGTVISYQSPSKATTVYLTNSLAGPVSAVQGGLLVSAEQFMLSQGVAIEQRIELDSSSHSRTLFLALSRWHQFQLVGFLRLNQHGARSFFQPLFGLIWPVAAAITLYLLIITQWTAVRVEQTQTELEQVNSDAAAVLTQREQVQKQIDRFSRLQQVLPGDHSMVALWQVLVPLYKKNVLITTVNQQQQQVSVTIEAPSATEALQLLLQQPGVSNAELEGNVRRQGDREQATVRFDLKGAD
ncbi:hypothetical protein ACFO3I_17680 [Rheinheimera marina]|uniref:General secretion pathway protein GspL n=1 Tax=Rheinheimera marina TaxID=1774958 RepID=A0ABV9JRG8_9GAMM